MEVLRRYDWPGNIRELKNLVERLSIMVSADVIGAGNLPTLSSLHIPRASEEADSLALPNLSSGKTLREVREAVERVVIGEALEKNGWNVTQAAKVLGIERTNLHKKIKAYDLER